MKKILAEIKAQFESVKGQPTLEELIAKDPELQELCRRIRQGSAADPKTPESQKTQQQLNESASSSATSSSANPDLATK